jgi:uncharacterized membrane protein YbaN (DUF454 family)
MIQQTRQFLWRALALLALVAGIVGLALTIVPTVPFLILAAFAGGKGWPALERWLLAHPTYGPHIHSWRQHGAVPFRAKVIATLMMSGSAIGLVFGVPRWAMLSVLAVLVCVLLWLWTRPNPPPQHDL